MGAKEWVEAAEIEAFKQTDRKLVDLGRDQQIGVFKVENQFFAVNIWCSHMKTSMLHGDVDGYELICPLHGARFDLRTGRNLSLPAVRPVPAYPVKIENGKIYIQIRKP